MTVSFAILVILIALGFVSNSLVILVSFFSWSDLSIKDLIVLSLAIADLLQTSLAYPYLLTDYDRSPNDELTIQCVMSAILATITVITSIAHFVAFFVKLYMAIEFPFRTEELEKRRFGGLVFIVPCWVYGIVWAICPILGWGSYGKETDTGYRCGLNFRTHTVNVVSYNAALVVASFILPIAIALICNRKIICAYRRLRNQAFMNSQMQQDTCEQMYKVYFVSVVMFVAFAISWSPYAALVVLNIVGVQPKQNLLDAAAIIAKTSAACNPIIYALLYKTFRERTLKLLSQVCKKPDSEAMENDHSISYPIGKINQTADSDANNQSSTIKDPNNQSRTNSIDQWKCANIIQPDIKVRR